jgi:lipid-A-disaccharide synthase
MRAIKARRADAVFAGIGGADMAAEGLASLFPIRDLSVMGLLEVLPKIVRLRALLRRAIADIRDRKPDILVTIDSPGFTLRVLRGLQPTALRRITWRPRPGRGGKTA